MLNQSPEGYRQGIPIETPGFSGDASSHTDGVVTRINRRDYMPGFLETTPVTIIQHNPNGQLVFSTEYDKRQLTPEENMAIDEQLKGPDTIVEILPDGEISIDRGSALENGSPAWFTQCKELGVKRALKEAAVLEALTGFQNVFWGPHIGKITPIMVVDPDSGIEYQTGIRLSHDFPWTTTEKRKFRRPKAIPIVGKNVVDITYKATEATKDSGVLDTGNIYYREKSAVISILAFLDPNELEGIENPTTYNPDDLRFLSKLGIGLNLAFDPQRFKPDKDLTLKIDGILQRFGDFTVSLGTNAPQLIERGTERAKTSVK